MTRLWGCLDTYRGHRYHCKRTISLRERQRVQGSRTTPERTASAGMEQPSINHPQVGCRPRQGQKARVKHQNVGIGEAEAHLNIHCKMPQNLFEQLCKPTHSLLEGESTNLHPRERTAVSPFALVDGSNLPSGQLEIQIKLTVRHPGSIPRGRNNGEPKPANDVAHHVFSVPAYRTWRYRDLRQRLPWQKWLRRDQGCNRH